MKIGIEVEGRFKGLKTLFASTSDDAMYDAFKAVSDRQIPHLYISCEPSDLHNLVSYLRNFKDECIPNTLVTVECSEILDIDLDSTYIDHFMLDITPDVHKLRPQDSIKSHDGDLNVLCTHVETMVRTVSSDFNNDKDI